MVRAIKYIANKELNKENNPVNFYFAYVTADDKYSFVYKNTYSDLEEIFKSFNVALDKINEYGKFDKE